MPRIALASSLQVENASDLFRCALIFTPKANGAKRHGRSPVVEIEKTTKIHFMHGYGLAIMYGMDEPSLAKAVSKSTVPALVIYVGKPKADGPLLSIIDKVNASKPKSAQLLLVPAGSRAVAWDLHPGQELEAVVDLGVRYLPKKAPPRSLEQSFQRAIPDSSKSVVTGAKRVPAKAITAPEPKVAAKGAAKKPDSKKSKPAKAD